MRILVTGGAGSFGKALVRRLLKDGAERVAVFSRDEFKHAMMQEEFGDPPALKFFVGDVRDRARLEEAMWGCEAVVHAAALKRVDSVAYNPAEVRKTNVEGSANVAAAAIAAGVGRVLMTSSDKAVEPTNCYGASKAQMEHEAVATNAVSVPRGTRIACTRWGNVLGSRGSVVHVFRRALDSASPIPLTHPDCTRFWLTMEEAVDFACAALAMMRGGEVFVPRLPAMRIADLAKAVAPGWPTVVVGMRPGGEKIHEVLMNDDEAARALTLPGGGYLIRPALHPWTAEPPWQGMPVAPGFRYASDRPERWLTITEMRELLKNVPDEC